MKNKPDGVHQHWGADGKLQFEVWYGGTLVDVTRGATAAANALTVAKRAAQLAKG